MLRRRFLGGLAAGLASLAVVPRSSRASAGPRAPYHLFVLLGGGIDAILSLDPKTRTEVDPSVDLPYDARSIHSTGEVAFGPNMVSLAPWAGRAAVLRGVLTGSVAHVPAVFQLLLMRRGIPPGGKHVAFLDLVGGAHRTAQFPVVRFGGPLTPKGLIASDTVFERLLTLSPEELDVVRKQLRKQADWLAGSRDREGAATASRLRGTVELLDRLPALPGPAAEAWTTEPDGQEFAQQLQRCLWLFEHDLTACALVHRHGWDTHTDNYAEQGRVSSAALPVLARFFEELAKRTNSHGSMLDQVRIIVGSELGRFPRLNTERGKHHFPEVPMLFMGAGIPGGRAFGRTGRMMEALPMDLTTGRATRNAGSVVTLDDVGATLLRSVGVDPELYGNSGRHLPFLVP
ncbi:MAG TPA: DUF1501 domain-containing protein [Kofleriaceae bacterium]